MDVPLPPELTGEIEELVRQGEFPDAPTAVVELVRQGLSYRYRRTPTPPMPLDPRERNPHVPGPGLPDDLNWAP